MVQFQINDNKGSIPPQQVQSRNAVLKKLQDSGHYDRLKHELYAKLMLDDTWREDVLQQTRHCAASTANGLADLTLDALSASVVQVGCSSVPESIKNEILPSIVKARKDMPATSFTTITAAAAAPARQNK